MNKRNSKKNILWSSPSLLPRKIVFIDGVTRSGKSMLGPVVSSFTRTYPMQQQTLLDNLLPMYEKNSIKKDIISSLLKFYFNKNVYYINISREINLRPKDNSSFVNNKDYKKYLKNLKIDEGDHIIKEIQKKNYYPIYMSHDLLSMLKKFNNLEFPYKLIHIYRHPVDNIFSFFKRYQLRLSSKNNTKYNIDDPRIHQMMIEKNERLFPYYTHKNEKKFLSFNFFEKSTFYYLESIKNSIRSYKNLKKNLKQNILLIRYDDFAEKTYLEMNKICKFLNVKKTSYTKKILIKNNLPRKMYPNEREFKLEQIRKNVNKNLFSNVIRLTRKYDKSKFFI